MKRYEVMYVVDPANEEGIDEVKKKVEGIITGREGVIVSYDKLGKKRLAYTIAKRQYGVYYLIDMKADARIVQALDYFLRLNQVVLRFIILAFSDKELNMKQETERIQLEEAERMRMGGRPLPGAGKPGEEDELLPIGLPVFETEVEALVVEEPTLSSEVEKENDGEEK